MLKQIPFFLKGYAGVADDRRAVHDFMECESTEAVNALRNELVGVAQGSHPTELLDKTLGASRKIKFGSHEQWAKFLLQWMAAKKD